MAQNRKAIRDAIKAALQTVFAGPIYTSRYIDVRDETKFVNVYFEGGEIEFDGVRQNTTASVVVEYNTELDASDDDIDSVADALIQALETEPVATDIVQGFYPVAFEYLPLQESAFNTFVWRFTVIY